MLQSHACLSLLNRCLGIPLTTPKDFGFVHAPHPREARSAHVVGHQTSATMMEVVRTASDGHSNANPIKILPS